jgi:hypothetical protein
MFTSPFHKHTPSSLQSNVISKSDNITPVAYNKQFIPITDSPYNTPFAKKRMEIIAREKLIAKEKIDSSYLVQPQQRDHLQQVAIFQNTLVEEKSISGLSRTSSSAYPSNQTVDEKTRIACSLLFHEDDKIVYNSLLSLLRLPLTAVAKVCCSKEELENPSLYPFPSLLLCGLYNLLAKYNDLSIRTLSLTIHITGLLYRNFKNIIIIFLNIYIYIYMYIMN